MLSKRINEINERAKDYPLLSREVIDDLGGVIGALREETGLSLEASGHLLRAIKNLIREEVRREMDRGMPF